MHLKPKNLKIKNQVYFKNEMATFFAIWDNNSIHMQFDFFLICLSALYISFFPLALCNQLTQPTSGRLDGRDVFYSA